MMADSQKQVCDQEVEVTDDMIARGVAAILRLVPEDLAFQLNSPDEVVRLVFGEMARMDA